MPRGDGARLPAALGHRQGDGERRGALEAAGLCHGLGALPKAQGFGEKPPVHVSTKGMLSRGAGAQCGHSRGDDFHTRVLMSIWSN